jgi:probable phosphoglycerate mutase
MDEFLNPPLPYGDFFVPYGGESQNELQKRVVETLTQVMEQDDHQSVLAVSHGAAVANFIRAFGDYNKKQLKKGIKNCTVFKLYFEDGHFCLLDYYEPDFEI